MKHYAREFVVPRDMLETFRLVFDEPATLDAVHGSGRWTVTPWVGGRREMTIEMAAEGLPPLLLALAGRGRIAVRVQQTRSDGDGTITVSNRMRPAVLGAELVRIRPEFTLREAPDGTAVAVACEVRAIAPRPLAGVVEGCMVDTAERSFAWLQGAMPS